MTALVVAETVILLLLALLVAGLLRSHAEILRRLDETAPAPSHRPSEFEPGLAQPRATAAMAADVAGTTPAGDALHVAVTRPGRPTLLAFLTSGCGVCQGFWDTIGTSTGLPADTRLLVVTKGGEQESPSRIGELAPKNVQTLMSTAAWEDYRVPGAPYFVFVDAGGTVAGEGAAQQWSQVISLFRDARGDAELSHRSQQAVDELTAAGITPGHPSLYGRE